MGQLPHALGPETWTVWVCSKCRSLRLHDGDWCCRETLRGRRIAVDLIGVEVIPAFSAGSQEPNPAERDDRTWTLYACAHGCKYARFEMSTEVHATEDPENPRGAYVTHSLAAVEVVPRSERDYWQQAYEAADRSLKGLTVRGGLARVQEQRDQARGALKELLNAGVAYRADVEDPDDWSAASEIFGQALNAAAAVVRASGVTEKGDGHGS